MHLHDPPHARIRCSNGSHAAHYPEAGSAAGAALGCTSARQRAAQHGGGAGAHGSGGGAGGGSGGGAAACRQQLCFSSFFCASVTPNSKQDGWHKPVSEKVAQRVQGSGGRGGGGRGAFFAESLTPPGPQTGRIISARSTPRVGSKVSWRVCAAAVLPAAHARHLAAARFALQPIPVAFTLSHALDVRHNSRTRKRSELWRLFNRPCHPCRRAPLPHKRRQLGHRPRQCRRIDVGHVAVWAVAVAGGVGVGHAPVQRAAPLRHVFVAAPNAGVLQGGQG